MLRRKLGDANAPPIFFLPKNRFLTTELKSGKYNRNIFVKQLFGWCKDKKKKMKTLRFTGSRIEASESPFYKGNESL